MNEASHQKNVDNATAIADYVSASLLGLIFLPCFVFILELFGNIFHLKWQLPVVAAAFVPFIALTLLRKQSFTVKLAAVLLLIGTVACALALASLFYDDTSDSTAYHADAILALLNGVNPIYEWMNGFDNVWVNHYPKLTWYFASIIIHLTGNYNLGKSCNLMLVWAVAAYVFSFMKSKHFSAGNALLVAAAASLNPVAVYQIHTFYVDGVLASLITLAVFSIMAMLSTPRDIDKVVFILSACLLIVKFTGAATIGVFYVIVVAVWGGRYLYNGIYGREAPSPNGGGMRPPGEGMGILRLMLLVTLIGGIIMGYNPYISNTIEEGTPLYPLFGKTKYHVVEAQSPKSFNENKTSTLRKLLISIYSRTVNVVRGEGTAEPEFKIPFSIHDGEIALYAYNDVRIGAWGVLFSGIFTGALILFLASRGWKNALITIALIMVASSVLINPGSWWARYAPQVASLPLLMAIPALGTQVAAIRIGAKLIYVLLFLNSALIIPPNTQFFINETDIMQEQIDYMIAMCGKGEYEISDTEGYHLEQILHQNGIDIYYPKEDIQKTHSQNELFLLNFFPLDQVFLYKKGCVDDSSFMD